MILLLLFPNYDSLSYLRLFLFRRGRLSEKRGYCKAIDPPHPLWLTLPLPSQYPYVTLSLCHIILVSNSIHHVVASASYVHCPVYKPSTIVWVGSWTAPATNTVVISNDLTVASTCKFQSSTHPWLGDWRRWKEKKQVKQRLRRRP